MTTIIEDAKIYATHAKKSTVDADDIKLAIQCRMDQSFTSPPPRDVSPQEKSPCQCLNRRIRVLGVRPLCAVPVGGGEAEKPDPVAPHQTVHWTPTSPGPLLPDGAQLQTQIHTEEGKDAGVYLGSFLSLVVPVTTSSLCPSQVSSSASRITVPRLSVGAVSSRPSTPTLGEAPKSHVPLH